MLVPKTTRPFIGFNATGDLGDFTIYTSRRAGTVWFLKAPPKKPATIRQLHYRNQFKLIGAAWNALPAAVRANWTAAAGNARLFISGYNLFTWWQLKRDLPTLNTILRHAGVDVFT